MEKKVEIFSCARCGQWIAGVNLPTDSKKTCEMCRYPVSRASITKVRYERVD